MNLKEKYPQINLMSCPLKRRHILAILKIACITAN
jgi:hypothetical protein